MSQEPEPSNDQTPSARASPLIRQVVASLNLRKGLAEPRRIDASIRGGASAAGMNLWVLMFAILVASVGLNVNSTAVIIGAMLISPLMGPIVGVGYSLGMQDFSLLRTALRNLAVFTVISLATSSLYFTLSPLHGAGSELLARTSPTLWDVMIAFFGGAAGIVASTRRHASTVVPGVAIATALMPPLCTAGFALSQQRWDWLGGALYLYAINSVFIAWATLIFVKVMKLSPARETAQRGTRAQWLAAATIVAMALPSGYFAWRVVSSQSFVEAAEAAVDRVATPAGVLVLGKQIQANERMVQVTVAGEDAPDRLAEGIREALAEGGYPGSQVIVRSASGRPLDIGGLKREIQSELAAQLVRQTDALGSQVNELRRQIKQQAEQEASADQVARELQAQYPALGEVRLSEDTPSGTLWIQARWKRLSTADRQRIERWLRVRLENRSFELVQPLT